MQAIFNAFQVGVFSATLPPEALEITKKFMHKPVRILVKRDELTLEGIKQVRFCASVRVAVERTSSCTAVLHWSVSQQHIR